MGDASEEKAHTSSGPGQAFGSAPVQPNTAVQGANCLLGSALCSHTRLCSTDIPPSKIKFKKSRNSSASKASLFVLSLFDFFPFLFLFFSWVNSVATRPPYRGRSVCFSQGAALQGRWGCAPATGDAVRGDSSPPRAPLQQKEQACQQ